MSVQPPWCPVLRCAVMLTILVNFLKVSNSQSDNMDHWLALADTMDGEIRAKIEVSRTFFYHL